MMSLEKRLKVMIQLSFEETRKMASVMVPHLIPAPRDRDRQISSQFYDRWSAQWGPDSSETLTEEREEESKEEDKEEEQEDNCLSC